MTLETQRTFARANLLAEDNRWRPSVLELRGPHGLEKFKR